MSDYLRRRVEELERERWEKQREYKNRENRLINEIQNERSYKEEQNRRLRKQQDEERKNLFNDFYEKETDLLKQNYKEKYENDYKRNLIQIKYDGENKNTKDENNHSNKIKKIEDEEKIRLINIENKLKEE